MFNQKFCLSLVFICVLGLFPSVVNAQQVSIKTGNMHTLIDDNGNVYIETDPYSDDLDTTPLPSDKSSRTSDDSANCRNDSYTYSNNNGNNSVYSRSSTTICQ